MENYIDKVCPYCKTAITEADAVKVCPACGIPHHEGCWNENKGCTTFGCSEQHYEAQHTNPTAVCTNCGAPLGDGQAFCPKCGTPKAVAPQKTFCSKCGNELAEGQEFCPRCGQKASVVVDAGVTSAIEQFNAGVTQANEAQKKKPMKALIAAIVAVAVILIGALVAPKLFVSVEELCEQGRYVEAYEKAEGAQKDHVLAENIIAVLSEETSGRLKDPGSFELQRAYYRPFINTEGELGGYAVLYSSGANSYGASVSDYMAYVWSQENQCWEFWGSCKTYTSESDDEMKDTLIKIVVKAAVEKGIELDKSQVRNINAQFQADTLYQVVYIDRDAIDTSRFDKDNEGE